MSEHELWNELGNLYFQSGSYDQAVHAYNKAIQLDSGDGKLYSNLALTYAHQSKYEDAIHLYKRSLEHLTNDKEKAITWNRLGNVYRHLKEYSEALIAFKRADELQLNNTYEDLEQSDQLLCVSSESESIPYGEVEKQQDFQNHSADYMRDIESEFDDGLPELVPVDADVLANESYYDQDTLNELTIENYAEPVPPLPFEDMDIPEPDSEEQVFSEEPIILEAGQIQGTSAVQNDQKSKEVVETISDEITLSASEATVHPENEALESERSLNEFFANIEKDRKELSNEVTPWVLEEELSSDEETPNTTSENAEPIARADAEDPDHKYLKKELVLGSIPETSSLDEINNGIVNQDAQRAEREINTEEEKLARQIEINPRSATTWEALGTLYKTTGRYDEAVHAFEQAISIAPGIVSYYHNLGLVYSAKGENKDAFNTFQKVLELDPKHSLTHASLGGYYKKIGLDELAQKHIGKAMKHIYESENEYNRACLDAICGNTDQAIDLLRVALENEQTYVNWVLHDSDLDTLREDERFKQLISEYSK